MKTITMLLLAFIATNAQAEQVFNCEKSAVNYILHIASAPYLESAWRLKESDLALVSRRALGDGAEAYEQYIYRRKDSNEIYQLMLYVQEIGGVCPLEKFEISSS